MLHATQASFMSEQLPCPYSWYMQPPSYSTRCFTLHNFFFIPFWFLSSQVLLITHSTSKSHLLQEVFLRAGCFCGCVWGCPVCPACSTNGFICEFSTTASLTSCSWPAAFAAPLLLAPGSCLHIFCSCSSLGCSAGALRCPQWFKTLKKKRYETKLLLKELQALMCFYSSTRLWRT